MSRGCRHIFEAAQLSTSCHSSEPQGDGLGRAAGVPHDPLPLLEPRFSSSGNSSQCSKSRCNFSISTPGERSDRRAACSSWAETSSRLSRRWPRGVRAESTIQCAGENRTCSRMQHAIRRRALQ